MKTNKKTRKMGYYPEAAAFLEGTGKGVFFSVVLLFLAFAMAYIVTQFGMGPVASHYANCAYNSDLVRQGIIAKNFSPITTTLGQIEYMRLGEQLRECAIKLP